MKRSNESEAQLTISKKKFKGDDSHRVFSIRVREETVAQLEEVAEKSNRSRNEVINLLLEYALAHCEIVD
ncbi:MAG: ribbon-helix-helix protein, CopG family [Clostridia bacterium]|nr:ribbon-helix-helix protein, CopG family [Clostridia bacterium]